MISMAILIDIFRFTGKLEENISNIIANTVAADGLEDLQAQW